MRPTVFVMLLAAAGYAGLAFWVGWRELVAGLGRIGVGTLLGGVVVVTLSLLVRFARWHHILRRIRVRVPIWASVRVYLAGLALTTSPGKLGETLRSALLLRWRAPVGASLAAFVVDRLCDLLGVALLAALAGPLPLVSTAAAVAALGAGAMMKASTRSSWSSRWLRRLAAYRLSRPVARILGSGRSSYRRIWSLPRALAYAGVGAIAYGLQALVFAAIVLRLWPQADALRCVGFYATATLTGAASMIPGGLGVMELTSIALLVDAGMPAPDATAAVVSTRAVTLWYAILLGIACLASAPPGTAADD